MGFDSTLYYDLPWYCLPICYHCKPFASVKASLLETLFFPAATRSQTKFPAD